MRIYFFTFLLLFIAVSCRQKKQNAVDAANIDSLTKDIVVLSSEEFKGRKPSTIGEEKTITYLKKQLDSIGVEPGNGQSYFQQVPLVNITTVPDSLLKIAAPEASFYLRGPSDYVLFSERTDTAISLKDEDVVFAGYGIIAPEYQWNDYENADVKNKIVLVLAGEPFNDRDSTFFKGDTLTYYGRWTYKYEEAARHGAKACLIIHNANAGLAFSRIQSAWNTPRLRLEDKIKAKQYSEAVGWISEPAATKLFTAAGRSAEQFMAANKRDFTPLSLNLKLSINLKVKATHNLSNNVIAKITGSKKPGEYVIYSAHWDHLGVGKPDATGDSIYNGAIDNASGTAGLLQIARLFMQAGKKPERTIIFLAVTAEEDGLLGSAYYVMHPLYPLSKTLANINLDGLNVIGKTKDIAIVGQPQSELEDYLKDEAAKYGRYIKYDASPQAGHYFRSDQFNFAKVGVPAMYAGSGLEVIGKEKDYGVKWKEHYGTQNYHQPSDEYNAANWQLDGALEDLKILYAIGNRIASAPQWPQWKINSEFKSIRTKSLANQ